MEFQKKSLIFSSTNYNELRDLSFSCLKNISYIDQTNIIIIFSEKNNYHINIPLELLGDKFPLFQAKINVNNTNDFNLDLLEIDPSTMETVLEYVIYDDMNILFKLSVDDFKRLLTVFDLLSVNTNLANKSYIRDYFIEHYLDPITKNEIITNVLHLTKLFDYVVYILNELIDQSLINSINKMY